MGWKGIGGGPGAGGEEGEKRRKGDEKTDVARSQAQALRATAGPLQRAGRQGGPSPGEGGVRSPSS
eukprot:2201981-Pyramimonas_sp.AAC.1